MPRMVTRRSVLVGAASAVVWAAGCSPRVTPSIAPSAGGEGAPTPDGLYFPPDDGAWETVEPAAAGWQPDRLAAAVDVAGKAKSTSFVVVTGGRIVAEQYFAGGAATTAQEVASVQKSVTSTLVANAADAGHLSIEDKVSRYLGNGWSLASAGIENSITLRHLLTMSSGLDGQLRSVVAPGTRWYYNSVAYHVLHPVLEHATGTSLADWSDRTLFEPVGMASARWELRPPTVDVAGYSLLSTARDMARFGLLILANGQWRTTRVLRPDYTSAAMKASQADNRSYGLLWWLNSAPRKQIAPAPADLVSAQGAGGQRIYVVPSLNTVVVRQSVEKSGENNLDETLWQAISAARA
jgi:CubicO group peptidase (beta-lactamase class C family)